VTLASARLQNFRDEHRIEYKVHTCLVSLQNNLYRYLLFVCRSLSFTSRHSSHLELSTRACHYCTVSFEDYLSLLL